MSNLYQDYYLEKKKAYWLERKIPTFQWSVIAMLKMGDRSLLHVVVCQAKHEIPTHIYMSDTHRPANYIFRPYLTSRFFLLYIFIITCFEFYKPQSTICLDKLNNNFITLSLCVGGREKGREREGRRKGRRCKAGSHTSQGSLKLAMTLALNS